MDAKFGPDGALYMLDYAGGFFSLHANQKLIRIAYTGGEATPRASDAAWRTATPSQPRSIAFSSARAGGVAWEWNFGDGSAPSREANPTHTYPGYGTYQATLKVTYADGQVSTATITVTTGCAAPDGRDTVRLLDTDTGVANREVGGGCTVNDLIDDERNWSNHGQFVSHVAGVVNELRGAGVLDNKEAARLNSSAAQSPIGKIAGYRSLFDGTAASLADWRQAPSGRSPCSATEPSAARAGSACSGTPRTSSPTSRCG